MTNSPDNTIFTAFLNRAMQTAQPSLQRLQEDDKKRAVTKPLTDFLADLSPKMKSVGTLFWYSVFDSNPDDIKIDICVRGDSRHRSRHRMDVLSFHISQGKISVSSFDQFKEQPQVDFPGLRWIFGNEVTPVKTPIGNLEEMTSYLAEWLGRVASRTVQKLAVASPQNSPVPG